MTPKPSHSDRVVLASSFTLCPLWIVAAIGSMLALQQSDPLPFLQNFVRVSDAMFVSGVAVSIAFAVYLAFRHSWRAMAALLSLSAFLGATACFLRYAGV